jgi:hypothetical protein
MAEWTNTKALEDLCHEYAIHYTMPHARVIEYGAGPAHEGEPRDKFMPPKEPIRRWAQLKVPAYTISRKMDGPFIRETKRKRKRSDEELDELTEAIRWHIYHYGIEPNPWIRPAIDDAKTKTKTLFKRNGMRGIVDYIITRAQENIDRKGIHYTGKMGQTFTLTDVTTGEVLENHGLGV